MNDTRREGPAESSAARAWAGVIAVTGALAGLGALVYFVGAVTMWVQLRSAQLPADVAITHGQRSELIGLGIRGLLIVSIFATLLVGVAWALALLWLRKRGQSEGVAEVTGGAIRGLRLRTRVLAVGAAVAIVVALAFTTWRWFGVGLAALVAAAAYSRYLARIAGQPASGVRATRPRPPWASVGTVVTLAIAAGGAAIALQLDETIAVRQVIIDPPPEAALEGIPIPYFGESADHLYVANLTDIEFPPQGGTHWRYEHAIMEISREDVERVIHVTRRACLRPTLKRPARALYDAFWGQGFLLQAAAHESPKRDRTRC